MPNLVCRVAEIVAARPAPRGYVVDVDTTDDFLDKPRLRYLEPDGSTRPLYTEEEEKTLGKRHPDGPKVPPSPDR